MVGLDGDLVRVEVGAVAELRQHAAAHLLRRLDGEGEAEDLARARAPLDQRDDRPTERVRLARARAGGDAQGTAEVTEDLLLLGRRLHSGTSPP